MPNVFGDIYIYTLVFQFYNRSSGYGSWIGRTSGEWLHFQFYNRSSGGCGRCLAVSVDIFQFYNRSSWWVVVQPIISEKIYNTFNSIIDLHRPSPDIGKAIALGVSFNSIIDLPIRHVESLLVLFYLGSFLTILVLLSSPRIIYNRSTAQIILS